MARKMKNSGVEWIGEIPEEWNLVKVKNLFNIGRGRVIAKTELEDEGYPVYSSQTKDNGVLGYISTYDFDRSQLTWTTDGANAGTVFLREGKHNCTNVCGTLMPKEDSNNLKYMKYALEFIAIYHKRADTNGFKIMNNEMAEIKITIPPVTVQQKIADFLDEKVGAIDTIIAKTKQSIEEYKKYKNAIIAEAVNKGLDKTVSMKESGIEWVGRTPMHWKINILSQVFTQVKNKNSELAETNLLSLSYGKIKRKDINSSDGLLPESFESYNIVDKNDIVLRLTDLQNDHKSLRVGHVKEKGIITSAYVTLRCKEDIATDYYYYYLHTFDIFKGFYGMGSGVRQGLNYDGIKSMKILSPSIKEQQQIADYLEEKCSEIDTLITKKESFIEEMETYKKSLIYEYVTGKKEVPV